MKIEQAAWQTLSRQMRGRWWSQRIEDKHSVGVPDVVCMLNGQHIWLELKAARDCQEPLKIRRSQIIWMTECNAAGGVCILLTRCDSVWYGIRVTNKVRVKIFLRKRVDVDWLVAIGAKSGKDPEQLLNSLMKEHIK
jgi:Holliday junction resolvase